MTEPALTPEEWRSALASPMGVLYPAFASSSHRLAAVCLYGQPFGFTREDVNTLRRISEFYLDAEDGADIRALADRIAALLPPEEPA